MGKVSKEAGPGKPILATNVKKYPKTNPAVAGEALAMDVKKKTRRSQKKAVERGKTPLQAKELERKIMRTQPNKLQPRLQEYLELLGRPFDAPIVKSPINYNPVPSFITSLARTTSINDALLVLNNTAAEISLFPGHGEPADNVSSTGLAQVFTDGDGTAFHANLQLVGSGGPTPANCYSMGPMPSQDTFGTCVGICGVLTTGLAVAGGITLACVNTNTANSYPIGYVNQLPYASSLGPMHARWKLLSMGVRICNITPELNRGGTIISVQPTTQQAYVGVNQYSVNATYKDHGSGSEGIELSWIPRAEDMAFWHSTVAVVGLATSQRVFTSSLGAAGLRVWFTNSTGYPQTYTVQYVWNWELAGSLMMPIGSTAVHQPADRNVMEPTLGLLRSTAYTAVEAAKLAHSVASQISPFVSGVGALLTG